MLALLVADVQRPANRWDHTRSSAPTSASFSVCGVLSLIH